MILGLDADWVSAVQLFAIVSICEAGSPDGGGLFPYPGLGREVGPDGYSVLRWYVSPEFMPGAPKMYPVRLSDAFFARIRAAWEAVPPFSGVRVEVPGLMDGECGLRVLRREACRRLEALSKTDELARDLLAVVECDSRNPRLFDPSTMTLAEKDAYARRQAEFHARMEREEAEERARGIGLDEPPSPPYDDDAFRARLGIGPMGWNYGVPEVK